MNKKGGFTFIEVMIAIVVFSVGVLAVLNLIVHNLSTMDKVQARITATFLAKEGIELAYNIRDTNLQKSFARDCVLKKAEDINVNNTLELTTQDICASHFASGSEGNLYNISYDPAGYYVVNTNSSSGSWDEIFNNNKLYYMTGDRAARYSNRSTSTGGSETSFARYILFTGVVESGQVLPTDKILKIESHVLFSKGSYTGDIVLESFIGNY